MYICKWNENTRPKVKNNICNNPISFWVIHWPIHNCSRSFCGVCRNRQFRIVRVESVISASCAASMMTVCNAQCVARHLMESIRTTGELPPSIPSCPDGSQWNNFIIQTDEDASIKMHSVFTRWMVQPSTNSNYPYMSMVFPYWLLLPESKSRVSDIRQSILLTDRICSCFQFNPNRINNNVFSSILEHIPPRSPDLNALSLVHRPWRQMSQCALYKNVNLVNPIQILLFVHSLCAHIHATTVPFLHHAVRRVMLDFTKCGASVAETQMQYFITVVPILQGLKVLLIEMLDVRMDLLGGYLGGCLWAVCPQSLRTLTVRMSTGQTVNGHALMGPSESHWMSQLSSMMMTLYDWRAFFNLYPGQSVMFISHKPLISEALAQTMVGCLPPHQDHDARPSSLHEVKFFLCADPCRVTPDFYSIFMPFRMNRPIKEVTTYIYIRDPDADWSFTKSYGIHPPEQPCPGCPVCSWKFWLL